MDIDHSRALVRTILEHAADYPWVLQDIGLLGLRLDERREFRLHVWAPAYSIDDPPVHDHPFDFTSTVVAGELTNVRYVEDPDGVEFQRARYTVGNEDERRTDTVRLSQTSTTLGAGDRYRQRAPELHSSHQVAGTVTIIRRAFDETRELTVCTRPGAPWVSGQSRAASPAQVKEITAAALEHFAD